MADFTEDGQGARHAGRTDNVVQLNSVKSGPVKSGPAKSNQTHSGPKPGKPAEFVSFDRRELDQILRLYGYKVAAGEWRDYAIDMLRDRAVFSVFKRTSEVPLFAIEKNPKLSRRQGAYSVVNATGQVLKRGHELANVLRVFEKKPKLATI